MELEAAAAASGNLRAVCGVSGETRDFALMAAKVTLGIDRSLVKAGERVCVAVSGGADSVALLVGLHEVKAELGVGLSAAHVHHGLRGAEADGDEAFVRELCARLGVALTVFRV